MEENLLLTDDGGGGGDPNVNMASNVNSATNMIKTMKNPTLVHEVKSAEFSCVYYGKNNVFDECPSNPTLVYYISNSNRNSNPYSNTYNLGWKHNLNFS
ncbi:hypothetical protein J1N35_019132 [Gossypium stocksii]|uniref:Uncharacterized protein n=1 Tax=Gossypium stocksii TaxID=47602 RepID=A0A9D3VRS1_9ROSI|nr:hypothetical protein J1N35_019132 [Gossypium stocksii]